MSSEYFITSTVQVLRDSPQRIDYHIRTGDYFSVLATLVGFLEEALGPNSSASEREKALARELRTDLRYVQANYKIVPRSGEEIQIIQPAGNILERSKAA